MGLFDTLYWLASDTASVTGWPASVGRMRSCCRLHRMDGHDCTWKQINNGELATQALTRASAVWRGLQQGLQAAHHLVECGAVPRLLCPTVPASGVLVSTPVLGEQPAKACRKSQASTTTVHQGTDLHPCCSPHQLQVGIQAGPAGGIRSGQLTAGRHLWPPAPPDGGPHLHKLRLSHKQGQLACTVGRNCHSAYTAPTCPP